MDRTARSETTSRLTARLATANGAERDDPVEQPTVVNMDVARSMTARFVRRGAARADLLHYLRDEAWAIRRPRPVQRQHDETRGAGSDHVARGVAIETCFQPLTLDVAGEVVADAITASGRPDPFASVVMRETLRRYLSSLPARGKLLLHLRFVEDCTQDEIAERLGMSQMHVSRLIRRHLAELCAAMEHWEAA